MSGLKDETSLPLLLKSLSKELVFRHYRGLNPPSPLQVLSDAVVQRRPVWLLIVCSIMARRKKENRPVTCTTHLGKFGKAPVVEWDIVYCVCIYGWFFLLMLKLC